MHDKEFLLVINCDLNCVELENSQPSLIKGFSNVVGKLAPSKAEALRNRAILILAVLSHSTFV